MKRPAIFLLTCSLLLSACGKETHISSETPNNAESSSEISEDTDSEQSDASESVPSAEESGLSLALASIMDFDEEDPANWINHYNNCYIFFRDGCTYRIFSDGLYRRAEGTDTWELLWEKDMYPFTQLCSHNDYLYFMSKQDGTEAHGYAIAKILWQYNLNTGECKEVMDVSETYYAATIYDGLLYLSYGEYSQTAYDVYRLDEEGIPREKLDESSPEFICAEQNEFYREEKHLWESGSTAMYSEKMRSMFSEVISIPRCMEMLNGYYLVEKYHDENGPDYYLRDSQTGENHLLFQAHEILAVTKTGIYYWTTDLELKFYSFLEGKATQTFSLESELYTFYSTTYNQDWLLFQNNNQILRMSRSTGELEVFLENIPEDIQMYSVDTEYFYLNDEMYPL